MTFPRASSTQIPALYCRWIGGLRWAHYGDAVEFLEGPASGRTFAFAPEIARFMEGFRAMEGGVPAFGHVLHLLYLIGLADRSGSDEGRPGRCLERIARVRSGRRDARCAMQGAPQGSLRSRLGQRIHRS